MDRLNLASIRAALAILIPAGVLLVSATAQAANARAEAKRTKPESARYLIQYPAGGDQALKDLITTVGGRVVFDYSALIDGLAADLSSAGVRTIRTSGLATTIEQDVERTLHVLPSAYPLSFDEFVGWGRDRVQADVVWSTLPNYGAADNGIAAPEVRADAVTGTGVTVGVLDSGIDYGHPDLADNILDLRDGTTIRDFIDEDDDPTDDAGEGHGSNVASVIASVDNAVGLIGVAPGAKISPYRVCVGTCPLSAIIGGVVQAVVDGVDVINMSFGGPAGFNIETYVYQRANAAGVTLVASAGNEATQQPSFPAAYDTVIAVGATDITDVPASFTNVGGWVDVTGPGVQIPAATCRGCGRLSNLAEVSPNPIDIPSNPMEGTAVGAVTAEIVDVGPACTGDGLDADPTGKVALIVRGACSFAEKVENAEASGAVATIVYNNQAGNFFGTLGDFPAAGPSVSVAQADGEALAAEIAGGSTVVSLEMLATDYELVDGTSFSGPHAAGVAALVLSVNPNLSPIEVRKIIDRSAEPIGPQVIFGNGMVRADRALEYVQ